MSVFVFSYDTKYFFDHLETSFIKGLLYREQIILILNNRVALHSTDTRLPCREKRYKPVQLYLQPSGERIRVQLDKPKME